MSRNIHCSAEQHYLYAEQLLAAAATVASDPAKHAQLIAVAQVHATLATVSERDSIPAARTHEEMAAGTGYLDLGHTPRNWTAPTN